MTREILIFVDIENNLNEYCCMPEHTIVVIIMDRLYD
jgi:hypothetical protein